MHERNYQQLNYTFYESYIDQEQILMHERNYQQLYNTFLASYID